jgi:DNA-binding CsgD family transcriptional regulator
VFEAVGIGELEGRLYRLLLESPSATPAELQQELKIGGGRLKELVGALEAKGLVSRSADPGAPQLVAAPPDVALEVLVLRRREELEEVRRLASELMDFYRPGSAQRSEELVEIIQGPDAILQRFEQLQGSAAEEILMFDTPPYVTPETDYNDAELTGLTRGISYRCVYDRTALEFPGGWERIELALRAGEEARVVPHLPIKLAIADRRLALAPLRADAGHGAVLVHESALLDALVELFEVSWQRGTPMQAGSNRTPAATGRSDISERDEELMVLLLAGLSDDAIGHRLGMSTRTVYRRIKRLMDIVGAETRLQLGWHAARAGWLEESDELISSGGRS